MTTPIKPTEVIKKKKETIPDQVIEGFNELIAKHWNGHSSTFKQLEVVDNVCLKLQCKPSFLYDNHYLDVEDIYRKEGWDVEYDKPAYCETYEPYFKFSIKKK